MNLKYKGRIMIRTIETYILKIESKPLPFSKSNPIVFHNAPKRRLDSVLESSLKNRAKSHNYNEKKLKLALHVFSWNSSKNKTKAGKKVQQKKHLESRLQQWWKKSSSKGELTNIPESIS